MSRRASFALFASIIPFYLGGSSALTPLYAIYREAWGFSPITITVVFATYALAVLAALLVVGSLSDHVGRRPVLIVATLMQIAVMAIFATAQSVDALLVGRVLQGLSAGAATGAVGAALLDVDRERGTVANAVAPTIGTALGGIVSGFMVAYLPAPTQLVYVAFGIVFALQTAALFFVPETAARRPGALASLRPRLHVPAAVRGPLLWAIPAMVAAWSIPGFYGSLGPLLVRHLLGGTSSPLHGGLALFVLAGSGSIGVFLSRARSPEVAMRAGTIGLVVGAALTWLAIHVTSPSLFFGGSILAGLGFGASFQGAVRSIVALAPASERAGVLSVLYLVAYLALGVPVVLGGIAVVHGGGIVATSEHYLLSVLALSTLALIGTLLPRRATAPAAI